MNEEKHRFARIPIGEMTPEYEKKRYIFLQLSESYDAIYGEIDEAELAELTPSGDKSLRFYKEIEMMFGVTPPEEGPEPVWKTVDRIYEKEKDRTMTADDLLNEDD